MASGGGCIRIKRANLRRREGTINGWVKAALAAGGGALGAEVLRRSLFAGPQPRYEPWERAPYGVFPNKALILSGGFAGYTAAKQLCKMTRQRDDVGIIVISRESFFTFWPMLAGCISNDIDTKNVAQPLRRALIRDGASCRRAEVEGVDVDVERQYVTADAREFPYDHLAVALGAEPAYFSIPGVQEYALSLKGIGAAEEIRNRVIERYEETMLSRGDVSDSHLSFVVIGGGAIGVEVASELHALVHDILAPDYPNINPHRVKIVLADSNEQILKELDLALRRTARKKLADLQIEVYNKVKAKEIKADRMILSDGRELPTGNVT